MLTGVCRLDPSSHALQLSGHLSRRSGRIYAVLHHAPLPFCRLELDVWCAAGTARPGPLFLTAAWRSAGAGGGGSVAAVSRCTSGRSGSVWATT